MIRTAEEEKDRGAAEEDEDREEGKHCITHIQQMMMGLSMDEVNEIHAFSNTKNF